ncbi:hypothetical protein, variant 3 [Aphanomyces astaci]|uniref:Fluoride ion transporter CrcB n=1 Tax=Aphanomyces astaci TaxID=112090 RepID=W4FS44_APHAT|nr:hypothetical protein, variant 2 [Aphanomyces astaci]XP_009840038.1 hypothetical protein, variant 3 [Aphanomyces astaci]ETV70325.1 hypothetical protein, variant 2 [Aphanomyces astaci]ETV70326.1 hypothetical protein, variant 3 [Aphanomyces astaci]|eukprot:XP_009840037.1 hypothetical protein, variant 2 [Aphanomyces astaci]
MYFDASPTSVKPPLLSPTLHAVLWIWVFAYIGVAARMGLAEVTTSLERSQARPSVLTDMGRPYFVANIVGCFVMGVCQPLKSKYTHLESVWVGITTGFCGCCTTFATWQLFTAHQYLTQLGVNATFVFFIQLTCCFGAHWGGRYIGTSVCESPVELPPAALALQLRKTAADQVDISSCSTPNIWSSFSRRAEINGRRSWMYWTPFSFKLHRTPLTNQQPTPRPFCSRGSASLHSVAAPSWCPLQWLFTRLHGARCGLGRLARCCGMPWASD